MDGIPWAALIAVGMAAGVVSAVVSLASVVSYPALLALGLPPVAANVTNTVALVFTGVGTVAGSRAELAGQGRRVAALGALTCAGGGAGAALLLATSSRVFEAVVPALIAFAAIVILLQPRLVSRIGEATPSRWWALAVFATSVYTGYFGAAGGVLQLAVLGLLFRDDLLRLNALKNAISGLANAVASIGFVLFGPVRWTALPPLALGFLVGGWLGARLARRLPRGALRLLIAGCGLAVAAVLAVRTYR